MEIYRRIESDFSFSREREYEARDTLSRIISDSHLAVEEIKNLLAPDVYVVGNSPMLEREIDLITEPWPVIAADNSAVTLVDNGIIPDIVITDLDGDVEAFSTMDSVFGVHAHGDNIHQLPKARKLKRVFGTTQVEPVWNVYNFGGFTDGDRAVCMAVHFGSRVHMVGFDFEHPRNVPGKDVERKRKKLKWARFIIDSLREEGAEIIWENLKS